MANSVSPRIGYNARLFYDAAGGSTFVEVAKLLHIKVPEIEVAKVKTTHLNSANYLQEHIAGLIEHSTLGFEFEYGTTAYEAMTTLAYARTAASWKILA